MHKNIKKAARLHKRNTTGKLYPQNGSLIVKDKEKLDTWNNKSSCQSNLNLKVVKFQGRTTFKKNL